MIAIYIDSFRSIGLIHKLQKMKFDIKQFQNIKVYELIQLFQKVY